jgi:hypothetical protein
MSLQAYLENMQNPNAKVLGSFNSIEGLVRSVLGDSFKEQVEKTEPIIETKQEQIIETKTLIPETAPDNIDEIVERAIAKATATKYVPEKQPEPEIIKEEEEPVKIQLNRKNEYVLHRDADEIFECSVNIEGGSSASTQARLIIKTDSWSLLFEGTIKRSGTCVIPIKKLHILPEGTTGEAILEVIVDDLIFVPWERPFRVATSKKVSVDNARIK